MLRSRDYVCGLNPANTYVEGRKLSLERNEVRFIEPLENKVFSVGMGIIEGDSFLKDL